MKTMKQVVSELQHRGYRVDYYVRKDGGILIRRIGEQKFTAAKGNIYARGLIGIQLSEAKSKQLKQNIKALESLRKSEEDIKNEWRRVRDLWRKAFPRKKGKAHPAGSFTWKRIKYSMKHYGREEALRRIGEAEKYASGIAYAKNVEILASFVQSAGVQYQSKELLDLAEEITANAYAIREEFISPAYDMLYKLNKGMPPAEVAANVRKILRLVV